MKIGWQPVRGYEGLYVVNELGYVKSLDRIKHQVSHNGVAHTRRYPGKILSRLLNNDGYWKVQLYRDNNCTSFFVHRLVAECFIPNPDNLPLVNHRNHVRSDARVKNLEWMTYEQNVAHGRFDHTYRSFVLMCPNGHRVVGKNVSEFCRTHNLVRNRLNAVLDGRESQHKGWRVAT